MRPSHGKPAIPPEIVSRPGASADSCGNRRSVTPSWKRRAISSTSSGWREPSSRRPRGSQKITANSSPPIRATTSWARTVDSMSWAAPARIASPAAWPWQVVVRLEVVDVEDQERHLLPLRGRPLQDPRFRKRLK